MNKIIRWFFSLCLITLSGSLLAQPANDLCTGATSLTLGNPCVNGTNVGAADNIAGAVGCQAGAPNSHEDVWYSFVSTGTQFTATFTSSAPFAGNIQYLIYSGTCAAPVLVASQCGPSPLNVTTTGLSPGTTYYIAISNGGTNTNGPFTICNYNTTTPAGCVSGTGPTCGTPVFIPTTIGVQSCVSACNTGNPNGPNFAGGSPCYDFLSATSWYSVNSGTAGTLSATVTSATLTQPHIAFFYTTDCMTYTQLGCATGAGGTVNLTNIGVPAGSTILIATNDAGGLTGSFNLCVTLNPDNSLCNTNGTITESSSSDATTPAGGPYNPGEIVNFCYTINPYRKENCNWLQGIVPTFGNCWDPASFNAQGMPVVTTALTQQGNETGTWSWWPAGTVTYNNIIGSLPPNSPMPAGWFFVLTAQGADPDVTYGDGGAAGAPANDCDITGNGYIWTVCFQLIAGNNCPTLNDCGFHIKTYADGETGIWNNAGCTGDQPDYWYAGLNCCAAPTITPISNFTVCNNTPFNVPLTSNQDPTVTYSWTVTQGLNITGGTAGSGANINQTLSNSGASTSTATYTVTSTNGSCASTTTFTVTVVPTINASISAPQTTLNCISPNITMTASSTSASPSYQWTGGPATAGYNISAPGTYTVIVTSTNGCTASATQLINSNFTTPTASAGPDQLLTCVATSVVLDGSGSTSGGGTTYSWSGPSFSSSLQSPTVTTPGVYTITVTNPTSGCTATDQVTVNSDPAVPVSSAGADQYITCLVSSVNLDGSGSSMGVNFTYSWTGPGGFSSSAQSPAGLSVAGVYTLVVTNTSNSCTATDQASIILDNLPPVTSAGSPSTITCTATVATLDGSGSEVGANINYLWNGPGGFNSSSQSPTTVTPGTYTITVTNTFTGCTNTASVVVSVDNTLPIADAGADDTLTCLTLSSILGGPGTTTGVGINYLWLGPASFGSVLQNPSANTVGTYTFTVTNSNNGCSATDSVMLVLNNTIPVADAGPFATITCVATTVSLDGSASNNGAGYTVDWSGPGGYSSSAVSPNNIVTPGTYTITVTDNSNGCTATSSVPVLLDNTSPALSVGPDVILTCAISSDTLFASSGASVNYSWSTTTGNIVAGGNTSTPIVDASGVYVVTATDVNNGCTSQDSVSVTLNATLPNASAGTDQILPCNTSSINLAGSSSTGNVTFAWTTIGGTIVSGSSTTTPAVNAAGQYIITVTDTATSCTQTDTVTVTNAPVPSTSLVSQTDVTCYNDSNGTAVTNTVGGTNPITFQWTPSGGNAANASGLSMGTYTITATDNLGCTSTATVTITQPPVLILTLQDTISPDCGSSNGSILVIATGGTPAYTYGWVGSATTGNSLTNVASGNYTGYVSDQNGCSDSLDVTLDCKALPITIPQFISPNGDGDNDVWVIDNLQYYPNNKVKIFNRWGNEIYSADPYANDWGGTPNISYSLGSGVLPTGTYFYVLDLNGDGSKIISNYIEIQK